MQILSTLVYYRHYEIGVDWDKGHIKVSVSIWSGFCSISRGLVNLELLIRAGQGFLVYGIQGLFKLSIRYVAASIRVFGISLSLNFRYTVYNASINFGYIRMNFFQAYWYTTTAPGRPCSMFFDPLTLGSSKTDMWVHFSISLIRLHTVCNRWLAKEYKWTFVQRYLCYNRLNYY